MIIKYMLSLMKDEQTKTAYLCFNCILFTAIALTIVCYLIFKGILDAEMTYKICIAVVLLTASFISFIEFKVLANKYIGKDK